MGFWESSLRQLTLSVSHVSTSIAPAPSEGSSSLHCAIVFMPPGRRPSKCAETCASHSAQLWKRRQQKPQGRWVERSVKCRCASRTVSHEPWKSLRWSRSFSLRLRTPWQMGQIHSSKLTRSWRAPVTFSLPGKGLTAAVRALKGLGGVFLRSTVAVAPARVDAFGPIGFGHCFRGLDGIGRFWAAVLAKMGLDPSHDLRLAGTSEDCQACRFLLRGQPEGVL